MNALRFLAIALPLALSVVEPARAESTADEPAPAADDSGEPTLEDGEREWGRDPGIGTTLSTPSFVIAGAASAVVIGLVAWMVAYRKPDGTVHPYDEG